MPIEVRREQVLDAALRLISGHGYRAATMEAIAREAELAKPVVYNAYPGLGLLLKALLAREEQRGLQDVMTALAGIDDEDDLDVALAAAVRGFLETVREHPVTWRLILLPAQETPREVREHVEAGRAFALGGLRTVVQAGLARRPGFDRVDLEARCPVVIGDLRAGGDAGADRPGRVHARSVRRVCAPGDWACAGGRLAGALGVRRWETRPGRLCR